MLDVLYNVVYCTVFRFVFVPVQIHCLLTTSCNFLQRMLGFFRHTSTTISANGPFSQSRSRMTIELFVVANHVPISYSCV